MAYQIIGCDVKMKVRCGQCNKVFDADIDPYDTHLDFTCPDCEMNDIIEELRLTIDEQIQCTVNLTDGVYTLKTNLVYLTRLDIVDGLIPIIESYGHEFKGIYLSKNGFVIEID